MLQFLLGFLIGNYVYGFAFCYLAITCMTDEYGVVRKLLRSSIWPYYLFDLMFGKDEE